MHTANFLFVDELNDFLPLQRRAQVIAYPFSWKASIKDMIQSLGVPHAEIELLIVNEASVGMDYIVQDGDSVRVYPHFEAVDMPDKQRLRPPLQGKARFVLDTHLGDVAAYLRMLGFDTLYRNDYDDEELAAISDEQGRVLLTRDIGLLKRKRVLYGYFMRNVRPERRLRELVGRFKLMDYAEPFKYCMKCNGLLQSVPKSDILDRIPQTTAEQYNEFHQCADCQQVYWQGTHYEKMQRLIDEIVQNQSRDEP
jgi:uncharacterized protein with PIN domain